MSVQAIAWVLDRSVAEGAARLVLLSLANHASSDGSNSYPSVETIRREARLKSRRTVQNALRILVELGSIVVEEEPGPRGQGRYRVLLSDAPAQNMRSAIDDVQGAQSATGGGASDDSRVEGTVLEPSKEPSPEQLVWDYYIERIPSRRRLADKQKAQIRNALKVRSIAEIKRAIDGLAASPHHNGKNDRDKTFLDLHYAIVPRGAESIEERIDKAIAWAAEFDALSNDAPKVDQEKVRRWLEEVQYTLSQPHRPERQRGEEARQKLIAAGFKVTRLDAPPWARLSR